ncbi:MAG TPA: TIM-barrel domain-containing protein [Kofleriaceae bacterium]|nr:TIM-barrel domain-containing protein [Kofleriaceae bacterium]
MSSTRWCALGLWLMGAAACGGGGDDAGPPVSGAVGGFSVTVTPGDGRVEATVGDGLVVLDTGAGGISVGTAAQDIQTRFGMFDIEERDRTMQAARTFGDVSYDAAAQAFAFTLHDGDAAIGTARISAPADGELLVEVTGTIDGANRTSIASACGAGEHFVGLGGQSFDVDHRGQRVPLWVSEDGISKQDSDDLPGIWALVGRRHTTHSPIPAFLSSRGYATLVDTPAYAVFDLCATDPAVRTLEAWQPGLALHVFATPAADPAGALRLLTDRTGRPRVPPAFAFAPWMDAIFGSANVRRVAARLRSEHVPSSVIWTEDWRGGTDTDTGYQLDEDWGVDRALYPDFEQVAGDLHAAGFKFLTYYNSFLVKGRDVYDEATAAGDAIHDAAGATYTFTGPTFEDTSLVDLSNPAARAWTKGKIAAGFALGADGHMADFAEWLPTDATLASGEDPLTAHNRYAVEWARLQREVIDEQQDGVERLFFARAAHLGSQPLVDVLWPGDQQTDWSAGDGLPSVIPMGLGLGVVGFPFFGGDIGGYMSQLTVPTTRELWFRWVTLGALEPVMRTHHGRSARQNWNWESDAASTAHLARWARFHLRLLPYLLASAQQASATGMPIMRPVAFADPSFEPGWTSTDQFMLGDALYVAPVVTEGATSRTVDLPPGITYHPLQVQDGGRDVRFGAAVEFHGPRDVPAALDDLPIFVGRGAVLVLLPANVDTVVPTTDPSTVTLADAGDDRTVLLTGGASSRFEESGGLVYDWHADDLAGAPASATWNGAPIAAVDGAYDVTGPGTLVLDGGSGRLVVTGGAADRRLAIRVAP